MRDDAAKIVVFGLPAEFVARKRRIGHAIAYEKAKLGES
jgi:hypothetical protein